MDLKRTAKIRKLQMEWERERKAIKHLACYWLFEINDIVKCHTNDALSINPRLTKLFFVTRLTKRGVVTTPSLDFPNRTPYEIDFGINR